MKLSFITIPPSPVPFSPQALWRDKSPPRHSCTMESIDDPLTDSQFPATTTTTITTAPPLPWPQRQEATQAATEHQEPCEGSKVQDKSLELESRNP